MKGRGIAGDLLELLLPRGCLACGDRIPPEEPNGLVCPPCRIRLRPPPSPFCPRCQLPGGTGHVPGEVCLECQNWPESLVSARAAAVLEETAGALVHALKYGGWSGLAGLMAGKIPVPEPTGRENPLVVPVPTTRWRRRMRGYNQARILAGAFAERTGFPLVEALARTGGRSQVRLGPRDRAENVQGAFRVRENACSRIRAREVILIDDVLTTGATACAAARTLEARGVARIHLRTFARALPFS